MWQTIRRWGLLVIVGGIVLGLDQWAKWLVVNRLALGESWEPIPAISGFIRVTRSYNTGAAFGMLPFASDFFLLLALITIVIFVISYPRLPSHAWLSRVSVAMISGGALSNAIDRIRLGQVVDYVHVQITPTFSNISNFADHAITVGVILLLLDQWRAERHSALILTAEDAGPTPEGMDASGNPESEEVAPPEQEALAEGSQPGIPDGGQKR